MELVNEAVELHRRGGSSFFDMLAGVDCRESLDERELNEILKRERAAKKYVKATAAPSIPPWMRGFEDAVDFDDEDDEDDEDDVFHDAQFNLFMEELQAATAGKRKRKRYGRNSPF
jgi:hypothetical protein